MVARSVDLFTWIFRQRRTYILEVQAVEQTRETVDSNLLTMHDYEFILQHVTKTIVLFFIKEFKLSTTNKMRICIILVQ
jgi:hypothetical protein